jgi:uncharacterized phage protein (TIGR01671 family)
MRALKFRAWDKDCCRFEYFEIGENDDYYGMFRVAANKFGSVVEQYTGLKDKNGKEIYEGDILGGIWEGGYIAWCDRCKQFQYHILTNGCMACLGDVHWFELVEDDGKLEVIGNIHENPELVGGEE